MTKSPFGLILIAAVLGAFLTYGRADENTKGSFTGAIESLDVKIRELKVKSESSDMTFLVAKDARIVIRENTNARLDDLKVGDKVVTEYEEKNGIKLVLQVAVKEKNPPAAPTAGEPLTRP